MYIKFNCEANVDDVILIEDWCIGKTYTHTHTHRQKRASRREEKGKDFFSFYFVVHLGSRFFFFLHIVHLLCNDNKEQKEVRVCAL